MPKQVVTAYNTQLVADARLLPQLQLCANGFERTSWIPVDSLSVDVAAVDRWVEKGAAALIIDARSDAPGPCYLPPEPHAGRVIVVVDSLSTMASASLIKHGYCITTVEEIGNGRLALLLKQVTSGVTADPVGSEPASGGMLAHSNSHGEIAIKGIDKAIDKDIVKGIDKGIDKAKAAVSLNQIAVEMFNRVDLPSLLQHIADNTSALTGADYSYVAMVHESGEYLQTIAANNDSGNLRSVRHRRGEGIGGQVWLTGKTVCEPNYQYYKHKLPGLTNARQACSVPLKLGDRVIGVIGILYEDYEYRIEDQIEILEMFSPLASVAIDNARLHENNRLELARTEAISKISRAIYSETSFDKVIDRICTTLIDKFSANKTHLYRISEDGAFDPLAARENVGGKIVPTRQAGSETVEKSVASWCIKNQKSAFIKRGVDDKRESADVHQMRKKWRLGSTICLPLVHEGKSWGVLFAHRFIDRTDFTESELKQFELIAVQISMALLRRELMTRVEHQAFHDGLTGLYNRWRFESLLTDSLEQSKSSARCFAVISIDLLGFKVVNDAHGHGVGDQLLKQVAMVLASLLDREDALARMGGDEFSIIASSRSGREEIIQLARDINHSLSQPLLVGNVRVKAGASIGICFYPSDANTANEVLKYAEFAMRHAKNSERSSISVFNRNLLIDHENRIQLELDLRYALATRQFELHYQPKVNCSNGLVDGVEALIRWIHPVRGFVPPSEFIPVAERCGLIEDIGAWVLDQACLECAVFQRRHSELKVAINISARQFNVDDFVPSVFATLEKNNLSAHSLELEVTESVVMHDIGTVVDKLTQLQGGGCTIAIDDFGTGYSSLQYLAELPLDVLKIDKSFVDRIDDSRDGQSLVKTILMMSRELDLKTVAEGVETESQRIKLQQLACDYIQGYYYSKPVPASQLTQVIDSINAQNRLRQAA